MTGPPKVNIGLALNLQHRFLLQPQHGFSSETPKVATKEEIDKLVKNKKLVVFMKGDPEVL